MDELLGFCTLLIGNKLHYYSMKHCVALFLVLPLSLSALKVEVLGLDSPLGTPINFGTYRPLLQKP